MLQQYFHYIAVEGPIGVGKTTLCRLLSEEFDYKLCLEPVHDNPFLSSFYESRKHYAFQTQIFFLLSRYQQQKEMTQQDLFHNGYVCDYLFAKDRLFAEINLSSEEFELYESVYKLLDEKIFRPDLVVFLQASIDVLVKRIRERDIPYEGKIDLEYLESLIQAYNNFFFHYTETPLLVVNCSGSDFAGNREDYKNLVREIIWMKKKELPKHYISIHTDVP